MALVTLLYAPVGWCDKLRTIFEGLLFAWFVPGSYPKVRRVEIAADHRADGDAG